MLDRIVVESLAGTAERAASDETLVRVCPHKLAELCRAWLALDAAPIDTHYALDIDERELIGPARDVIGQRVRIVATPTTRGPE